MICESQKEIGKSSLNILKISQFMVRSIFTKYSRNVLNEIRWKNKNNEKKCVTLTCQQPEDFTIYGEFLIVKFDWDSKFKTFIIQVFDVFTKVQLDIQLTMVYIDYCIPEGHYLIVHVLTKTQFR